MALRVGYRRAIGGKGVICWWWGGGGSRGV